MTLLERNDPAPADAPPMRLTSLVSDLKGVSLAIVEGRKAFLELRAEWDALFARAATPQQVFQSHVVLQHWMDHYLDEQHRPLIVTARRDERLSMVWPLVARRRFGIGIVGLMGCPIAQFGDIIAEPGPELPAMVAAGRAALQEHGVDLFEMRKVRADSTLARSEILARAWKTDEQEAVFADLLRRVGPDNGPSTAYPARERSNHRRRLRRLSERGRVVLGMVAPGPEARDLALAAVAMKRATLRRHDVIAPTISDPRFAAFFGELAADAAGASPLRVATIHCADETVGIDLALDCKGVTFGHVIAIHPDYERGGVGGLLIHHSFASAYARGSAKFDLLAPADPYKRDHADGSVIIDDYLLPLTERGRIASLFSPRFWRPWLKVAVRRLPPPLTRKLANWANSDKS